MSLADKTLLALLEGALPEEEEQALLAQIESDPVLRDRLATLSGEYILLSELGKGIPQALALDEEVAKATVKAVHQVRYENQATSLISLGERPEKIGSFKVMEKIAQGGMGMVYRAYDETLDREVALKVLHFSAAADPQMHERFLREARAMADINHRHVLSIHQVVHQPDVSFMAMHLAVGGSVQDKLDKTPGTPLQIDDIVKIAIAVSDALSSVHARGLVHRDIKPSNILLGLEPQEIWLADFGLVRDGQMLSLTRSHMFIGTPLFMSPEQAAGEDVDYRSDLYSLGAVLYTLATGFPPFTQTDFDELRRAISEDRPPPLKEKASHLPLWLRHLIESLLIKDREKRPANAAFVLDTLLNKTDQGRAPSRLLLGRRSRSKLRLKRSALGLLSLIVLGAMAFVGTEQSGHTEMVNSVISARSGHPFWITGQWGTFASLEAAVAALQHSRANHEIAINSNDTLGFGYLKITQPLTLRAANKRKPVLSANENGTVPQQFGHFEVLAPLTLRDITIHQRSNHFQLRPLFTVRNTELKLEHCRIVRSSRTQQELRSIERGLISAFGSARLSLDHTESIAFGSPVISLTGSGDPQTSRPLVKVSHSRIFGRFLSMRGHDVQVTLLVNRSGLACNYIIDQQSPGSILSAQVSGCLLITSRALMRGTVARNSSGHPWLRWVGRNNYICNAGPYLLTPDTALETIEEWQAYLEENDGACRQAFHDSGDQINIPQIQDARIFAGGTYELPDPQQKHGLLAPAPLLPSITGPRG